MEKLILLSPNLRIRPHAVPAPSPCRPSTVPMPFPFWKRFRYRDVTQTHVPVHQNVPARISRCLEGAEEFFLKPVRLADLNKLKPLMMKTKLKNQKLEEIEKPSKDENGSSVAVEPEVKTLPLLQSELEPKHVHLQVVQQGEQTLSNKKRKSMEGGLSTDRSRPRFDGMPLLVQCMVSLGNIDG